MMLSEFSKFQNPIAQTVIGAVNERPSNSRSTASALSFITHDIRNLLAIISLNAEKLLAGEHAKDNVIGDRILRQVDQITAICSAAGGPNTSTRARPHISVPKPEMTIYNTINEVVECLEETDNPITFQVICDAKLQVAMCRPTLFRILYNIISNAAEAMAETDNPRLKVVVMSRRGQLQIDIMDNGPGLPAPIQQALVTMRPDKTWQGGLGILIANMLMEEQCGQLKLVKSTPEGTHFRLIFEMENLLQ